MLTTKLHCEVFNLYQAINFFTLNCTLILCLAPFWPDLLQQLNSEETNVLTSTIFNLMSLMDAESIPRSQNQSGSYRVKVTDDTEVTTLIGVGTGDNFLRERTITATTQERWTCLRGFCKAHVLRSWIAAAPSVQKVFFFWLHIWLRLIVHTALPIFRHSHFLPLYYI